MRRSLVVLLVGALLAAAVGALVWWRTERGTTFESAVALAPAGSQRISWTDWSGVRRELGADVSARSSTDELTTFMDEAFERDLSAASALGESAVALQARFGLSPASVEWELLAQSPEGAVELLKMPESFDFDRLSDRLTELGFAEPSSEDGVWEGGGDLLARIDPTLTPELQYVAVDRGERLIRTSDSASYLEEALDADRIEGVDDVVAETGSPLAASVYSADYACSRLGMSQADETDQAQADALIDAAGEVSPLTGFAMSAQLDGQVRVALSFETDDQARANAESRLELASGPAPGQGGEFADRFEVVSATATGRVVVLDLAPVEGSYVLSDLSSGPVLFATC
ncbi:hypothetical protein [Nocardioides sp. LHG3406-4]|uniref:hypothetical protein n=1 Tax=Nocardioides sp. LHG3406-4 TaxID=2804575 RepID=UPI003CE9C747